jgi:hypothetical protein
MEGYLRQNVEIKYKQNSLVMDENNRVFKVISCLDLKWLFKDKKTGYFLTAKYLYTEEKK